MEILWRLNFSLCDTEYYTGEGHWSFERKSSPVEYSNRITTFPFTFHLTVGGNSNPT